MTRRGMGIPKLVITLLLGLTPVFCVQPARAKSENALSAWIVESPEITSEPITLKKGEFLQRARLLPVGLVELTADTRIGPKEADVIHSGAQLFELAGGTIYRPNRSYAGVFCQMKTFETVSKGMFGKSVVQYRYCLVDRERDGTIDDVVVAGYCPYDLPLVSIKVPSGPPKLTGSTYRRIPVKDFQDGPMVGIVFSGIAPLDGDPRFIQAFGSGNAVPLFGEKHSRAGKIPGQRISFGGAFTVLRTEGETVTIRNDRPIPPQSFGIVRTGSCKG